MEINVKLSTPLKSLIVVAGMTLATSAFAADQYGLSLSPGNQSPRPVDHEIPYPHKQKFPIPTQPLS